MNNQCNLIKNDQNYWVNQFKGNPIGNAQEIPYTCNPLGTDPIVGCPSNGEFKYVPGSACGTMIQGKLSMDMTNKTSIQIPSASKSDSIGDILSTKFTFTPSAGINTAGNSLGCGFPCEGVNCYGWPYSFTGGFDASGSLGYNLPVIGSFPVGGEKSSDYYFDGSFDINTKVGVNSSYFPFPGQSTTCERISYKAPNLGCCLNKSNQVQTYNGVSYTCDVNNTHKYSMDCGSTIADYCSTPDYFKVDGQNQNDYDNRDFKEWLSGGKCYNYFINSDSIKKGIKVPVGSNNLDAMELVLQKSIPAINEMYPVNNPGGSIITTFTFPSGGHFQINYGKILSDGGVMISLSGSYLLNDLITTIQNQINAGLGVNPITFGVVGNKFYLTPNQSGNIMQVAWISPFSDPTTATILGGSGISGVFSQGQQYIFPNSYQGVSVSMGKQIWDNVAEAVVNSQSGTESLKKICQNFTRKDIETSLASPPQQPDNQILAKMCACNLSSTNYSNFGGKIPPSDYAVCDPLCLASGTVPRYKNFKQQVCNNTNCIIDNTTINFINSTAGDITFNQVCSSGNGANCYFSDPDVFTEASKIGKVTVNQNCGRCFVYNPSTPFDPTEVDCLTGNPPTPNKVLSFFEKVWSRLSQHKWIVIGVSITIIVVIILLLVLWNISSNESQTQSLLSAFKKN